MAKDVPDVRQMVADAVRAVEFTETDAWGHLDVLSMATEVDNLEVFEDEILLEGNKFSGSLLWHVTLVYHDPEGDLTLTESFPGSFEGRIRDGRADVEFVTADTSSFYK